MFVLVCVICATTYRPVQHTSAGFAARESARESREAGAVAVAPRRPCGVRGARPRARREPLLQRNRCAHRRSAPHAAIRTGRVVLIADEWRRRRAIDFPARSIAV